MSNNKGFTLIELSIVLVIIGLIVSSIIGGQQLISQAQLRGVMSEVNGYKTAVRGFELQYDAIPGDMASPDSYWAAANYTLGGGNGLIDSNAESLGAWEHLSLAGIVPGSWTGTGNNVIGTNIPPAKVKGGGYMFSAAAINGTPTNVNKIVLGAVDTTTTFVDSALTSKQAKAIDVKIDDGAANNGSVRSIDGDDAPSANDCVAAATSGDYSLATTTKACLTTFYVD